MFGLLTEQTAIVIERHLKARSTVNNSESSPPLFSSWLRHVFPSLKIFTDWMTCNVKSFIPLPDQLPAEYGPHPDILMSLAKVINRIRTIDRTQIQLGSNLSSKFIGYESLLNLLFMFVKIPYQLFWKKISK